MRLKVPLFISILFFFGCKEGIEPYESKIINDNIALLNDHSYKNMKSLEEYAGYNQVKSGRYLQFGEKACLIYDSFNADIKKAKEGQLNLNEMKTSYLRKKRDLIQLVEEIKYNKNIFKTYDFKDNGNTLLLMQLDMAYTKESVLELLSSVANSEPYFKNKGTN